jgi:TRAP-type C4-dicarboxylate transport system permease small subunit
LAPSPGPFAGGFLQHQGKDDFLKKGESIFHGALDGLNGIAVVILVGVILSVMLEVFLRYFFNRPQKWVVEISEYALLYITFLSAAGVLRKEGHIVVDLLTSRLGSKSRHLLSIIQYVGILLVSIVLLAVGARTTLDHYRRGIYNPTLLQIPTAYVLVVIPVGGFFLFVQSVLALRSHWKKWKAERNGTGL